MGTGALQLRKVEEKCHTDPICEKKPSFTDFTPAFSCTARFPRLLLVGTVVVVSL